MTWISKLEALDIRTLNDGSEAFEVLIGEINLPLVWDYAVDPIFIIDPCLCLIMFLTRAWVKLS